MTEPEPPKPRHARISRSGIWCLLLGISLAGCVRDFGTGGAGERVVPRDRLRGIDTIDLAELSGPVPPATAPATAPATRLTATAPSSRPATDESADVLAPPPPPPETRLSIADARRLALENNLDLKVELHNPSIARTSVTEEQARYEALFTASIDYGKNDAATATQLESSQSESLFVDPGLEIPLRTGGTLRFSVPVQRFESDNAFTLLNPAYTAGPAVALTQPLLRGAGLAVNAQPIRIAFYQYQQAQARTKLEVTRVLADVDRVYWRLFAAREELKLRIAEHDLAVAQLERARRQERVGRGAAPDVVRAESGVADRLESIILAENALRDRQRELKRILNAPGLDVATPNTLIPSTDPVAVRYRLDGPSLAAAALARRMEMLDLELQIAQDQANVDVARNDLLPLVSLEYAYNINGLGPALDDSLTQVREKRFEDHRLGLRVQIPIGNEAARSRLRRAIYGRSQRLVSRDQRALQVRQEVLDAVDQLEANWQRIMAARRRVVAAARVVDVETRQFNLGTRTSTEVLDAQTNLANARLSEISAVTEYQIAQVDIAFATGTVLGASRVVWEPTVAPDAAMRR